ncbi:MAG TPA: hypothetical protein VIV60_01775 [Polyangiaceae bacterium]
MTCHRAIVWIDATEACILRMDNGLKHELTILAQQVPRSPDDPESTPDGTTSEPKEDAALAYFNRVARALDIADEILVVGPSSTKLDFVKYMNKNQHALDPRILGVETIASRTDSELAAFAKVYFTGGPRRAGNGG